MKLPLNVFKYDPIEIPPLTGEWTLPEHRNIIVDLQGEGEISAIGFRGYYATWMGYQVDEYPFVVFNNGGCLRHMGLVGAAGVGMPNYCPTWTGSGKVDDSCTYAFTQKIPFMKRIQICVGNSLEKILTISSVHVYFYADPLVLTLGPEGRVFKGWA